jgi:hypothetical protein
LFHGAEVSSRFFEVGILEKELRNVSGRFLQRNPVDQKDHGESGPTTEPAKKKYFC